MPWTDFARTDFAANKAGRRGRGDYLVERGTIIVQRPFNVEQYVEFSTTTASFQDAANFTLHTPDYALAGWFLHGHVYVKVAAGSGGQVRLVNVTDINVGTAQTGISGTTYAFSDDLSVQVDVGEHASVNIKVQVQGDGANLMFTQNNVGYIAGFWWEPS